MKHPLMNSELMQNNSFVKIAANSPLPILWTLPNSDIIFANSAACIHFGYSMEELLTLTVDKLYNNFSKSEISKEFIILKDKQLTRFETVHLKSDGTHIHVESVNHYVTVEDVEFCVSYIFDITEKKHKDLLIQEKTEELQKMNSNLELIISERTKELEDKIIELKETQKKLKASEQIFASAFNTSQDSINLNRLKDGKFISINEGFTRILGYTEDDVINKSSLELNIWKNQEDREMLIEGLNKNGFYRNLEADFVHKDGYTLQGLMSASIQEVDGEIVILSVSKDITKLKTLENELKNLNKNLLQKVKYEVSLRQKQEGLLYEQRKFADMGKMINAIAHQWRQPLNSINLVAQAMHDVHEGEDYGISFEELSNQHCQLIDYMSNTIDDFRNFFSPNKSKTSFSIIKELAITLDLIKAQFKSENITIETHCNCSDSEKACFEMNNRHVCDKNKDTLIGYPGELRQVFLNLISNAKDAINQSQINENNSERKLDINVTITSSDIVIDIHNQGMPIPDDVIDKIFDPYFTTKKEGKGTGIGLYMSRMIIEEHMKGKISCHNTNNGVCFTISLPLSK